MPVVAGAIWMVAAVLCSGCAQVNVDLNAYLARDASFPEPERGQTIGVVVASSRNNALLEDEVAAKVTRLLEQQGYTVAVDKEPDYVLTCEFAVDSGRTVVRTVRHDEPPTVYRSYYHGPGRICRVRTTTLPGRTRYFTQRRTIYTRSLHLSLIRVSAARTDSGETLSGTTLWQCDAHSPGQSADLRWVINHLLLAAFDHFGVDTGRRVHLTLPWEGERVMNLAAGD